MNREIWIDGTCAAVSEDGRLVEYMPCSGSDAGSIIIGKAGRIMKDLGCAFVEIGRRKAGFLPLVENGNSFCGGGFTSGDMIPVQIKKVETGEKGAFLTRDISLAGSYTIVMPMNRHIGVSSRIEDPAAREKLIDIGNRIAGGRFGIVIRAAGADTAEKDIAEEAGRLFTEWETLKAEFAKGGPPGKILFGGSPAEQLIRDYDPRGIDRIIRGELSADLKRQLRDAESRTVRLPHGGNIVIDRCEAMTVIDVNSASDSERAGRRETIRRTNIEACREICTQTRLRNLSGIIIIDLINMDSREDEEQMLHELKECFSRDRVKTVIHGMTSLGLVEMTRKRTSSDLFSRTMEPCSGCGGLGYVRRK